MPLHAQRISPDDVVLVGGVFRQGLMRAARSLSAMVGQETVILGERIEVLTLDEAVALAGPADQALVGVYVGITGRISGHVLLLFTPADARRLVGMLLSRTSGGIDHFGALAKPALGEVGNIMGSSFAIAVGDLLSAPLWSTAPQVQADMARALVDGLLASASDHLDEVLVGATHFAPRDAGHAEPVRGAFLFLPEPEGVATLVEAIQGQR